MFAVLEADGLGRALSSAGAALNTDVRVDHILAVALGDGFNGALSSAATAHDAIVGNHVCHVLMYLLLEYVSICLTPAL